MPKADIKQPKNKRIKAGGIQKTVFNHAPAKFAQIPDAVNKNFALNAQPGKFLLWFIKSRKGEWGIMDAEERLLEHFLLWN